MRDSALHGKSQQGGVLFFSNERESSKIESVELGAKPERRGVLFSRGQKWGGGKGNSCGWPQGGAPRPGSVGGSDYECLDRINRGL